MCKCECNHKKCYYCGKLVRIDKPLIGSLHICLSPEEKAHFDYARQMMQSQQNYKPVGLSGLDKLLSEDFKQQV